MIICDYISVCVIISVSDIISIIIVICHALCVSVVIRDALFSGLCERRGPTPLAAV
jgi:hypothetical protein